MPEYGSVTMRGQVWTPSNSPEVAVRSDLSTQETWNTSGTSRERSSDFFLQTEELCDVTELYTYMEPDAQTNSEQPNLSPTNPLSSKYNSRHNPKPNSNDDYRK